MLPKNSIEQFEFVALQGAPETLKRQLTVFRRAGVDGVQICDDARRGSEFRLLSQVDCASFEEGRQAFLQYVELIGHDAVSLIWNDWDTSSEGLRVIVLDVQQMRLVKLAGAASGGLNPPSAAWLECVWTLIPVFWS